MPLATASAVRGTGITSLPLNAEGFLLDRRQWDRTVAQQLADQYGLGPLSPTQWQIIDYIRDRYLRLGAIPPIRHLCRKLGIEREAVKKSFGGCRQLWQIAGLPNPGEEALTYMD
jgi:tRNA 2-thiouridine synthesizing protein E